MQRPKLRLARWSSFGKRSLAFEHPDTLLSRYNLASALYHEGKYREAERLYREVFKLDNNVIGPEHPRTLAAAHRPGKYT